MLRSPQPPRHALCRLRMASCRRRGSSRRTRQLARQPTTLGPFGGSSSPHLQALLLLTSVLALDARHGRSTPRTRVARALSGSMRREGSHAPCRRRRRSRSLATILGAFGLTRRATAGARGRIGVKLMSSVRPCPVFRTRPVRRWRLASNATPGPAVARLATSGS